MKFASSQEKTPKTPILAVDGLIFRPERKILLVQRAIPPFQDYWVLPGGHVEYGERVEKALRREMKEELGISIKSQKLIGVYSDPRRDPRGHTVSLVYLLLGVKGKIVLNFEASKFKYFSPEHLPKKIGFDHRKIIKDFWEIQLAASRKI